MLRILLLLFGPLFGPLLISNVVELAAAEENVDLQHLRKGCCIHLALCRLG